MIFHRLPLKSETFKKLQMSEPIDVPTCNIFFYCNILGTISKEIISKYKERRNGPNYKKQRSALDDLASLERTKKEGKLAKANTDSEFEFSDIDTNISRHPVDYSSDSLGQGNREQVFLT